MSLLTAAGTSASEPLPPITFCVDASCVTTATPTRSASTGLKFHPGHYLNLNGGINLANQSTRKAEHFASIATQVCPHDEVKGIQLQVGWALLESTAGNYSGGIALVREYLDRLAACGTPKYLQLVVQDRWFGGYGGTPERYLPAYLMTSAYGPVQSPGPCISGTPSGHRRGGVVLANGSDCSFSGSTTLKAAAWEAPVTDRLIALSRAYAAAFDDEPRFEMYNPVEELAPGILQNLFNFSWPAYRTQFIRLFEASRSAWPKTQLRFRMNYGDNDSNHCELLRTMVNLDVAIGGPDVLPGENIQTNRLFSNQTGTCTDFRGVVPWVSEVQVPQLGGKEGTYTASQLYPFVMDGGSASGSGASGTGVNARPMYSQYWVWVQNEHSGGSAQRWSTGLRPFVTDTIDGAVGSGRDSTRRSNSSVPCPSGYASGCVRN